MREVSGMSYIGFESFEAMQQFMLERTDEANQGLAPDQQQVTWGDCWARFDTYDTVGVVFGKVYTRDEWVASEMEAGSTLEEATAMLERIEGTHREGYMHGDAHSRQFPEGEYGATHRANLWPISRELYEAAAAVGWDVTALSLAFRLELQLAAQEWKQHTLEMIHAQQAEVRAERQAHEEG